MIRATKVPEELLDVITYGLIDDPVIAEDNFTYSRRTITDWYRQCKIDGEPVTSPMYRSEVGETLRPNYPLLQKLEEFKRNGIDNSIVKEREAPSIALLAKVFEVIDPIRDLFASMKWQPPALVVLGNEKSGKSTLLERLAMMPIFPKAKQICTRLAIHVRLRRGPSKPPLVEVYDKVSGTVLRDVVIPMEKGNEYVQDAMERVLKAENDGIIRGVSNKKVLILHVSSPMAPNLDLVDLPGLVSTYVRDEPENMQEMTRELVEEYIKDHATHSIYLVTIPASTATNQSLAMDIVQRHKLHARTIGILTKSDQYSTFDDDEVERSEIVRDLSDKVFQRSTDVVQLPAYGYVATMNKPVRHGTFNTNYGSLMYQAEREKDWFNEKGFSEIVDAGHATIASLINRLSSVYHDYMRDTWAPLTILKLEAERLNYSQKEVALGLPRADQFLDDNNNNNDTTTTTTTTTNATQSPSSSSTTPILSQSIRGNEGRVHREKISTLASELTMSLIRNYRPILVDLLCSKVLKKFQASILSLTIHKKCSPTDAIDLQRNAKLGLEKLCGSALDSLQLLVMEELKKAVYSDGSGFCLSRFPNYLNAVLDNCTQSLQGWRKDTEQTMLNYVAMAFQNLPINPNLSIKYNFEKSEPVAIFSFNSTSLSDVLPHVLVLRLSALMSDILNSSVQSAAQNTDISFWTENCAKERKALLQTMTMMEVAEEQLMEVLNISQTDFETYKKREIESKRAAAIAAATPVEQNQTTDTKSITSVSSATTSTNSNDISPIIDRESSNNNNTNTNTNAITSNTKGDLITSDDLELHSTEPSHTTNTNTNTASIPAPGFQKRPLVAPSEESFESPISNTTANIKPISIPVPVLQTSPLQSSLSASLDSPRQLTPTERYPIESDERKSNTVTTTSSPNVTANANTTNTYSGGGGGWQQHQSVKQVVPLSTSTVTQPSQQSPGIGSTTTTTTTTNLSGHGYGHYPVQSSSESNPQSKVAPAPGSMIRMLMERGVTITGAPLPSVSAPPSQPVIIIPSSVSTPNPATMAVAAAANTAVSMVGHPSGFPLNYAHQSHASTPSASTGSYPTTTNSSSSQFSQSTSTATANGFGVSSSSNQKDSTYSSPPSSPVKSSSNNNNNSSFAMTGRTPTAIYSTYSPYNSTSSPAAALEIFGMPGNITSSTTTISSSSNGSSIFGGSNTPTSHHPMPLPLSLSSTQIGSSTSVVSQQQQQVLSHTPVITAATYFSSGGTPAADSPFSPTNIEIEKTLPIIGPSAVANALYQPNSSNTATASSTSSNNNNNPISDSSDKTPEGLFQLPNPASLTLPNIPNLSGWFWNPAQQDQQQVDANPPSQGAE